MRDALDAVGQALVLADVAEPASLRDILDAVTVLGARLPEDAVRSSEYREFQKAATTLSLAASADPGADLEALGARFESLQRIAEKAEKSGGTAAARADAAEAGPESQGESEAAADAPVLMPLSEDEELIRDFVERANEHLDSANERLLRLEHDPGDPDALNAVFRVFHTIKGMAGFLALSDIEALAHETESILEEPRRRSEPLDGPGFDRVFLAVDGMRALVAKVTCGPSDASGGSLTQVADGSIHDSAARPESAGAADARTGGSAAKAVATSSRVRVDEERLDRLLDMIGEFVIAESMFSESARDRTETFSPLAAQLSRLDKITRDLQEMATSLRMVPLKTTFVRMARLVRDLSGKAGKSVELVVSGEETELDKTVVDRIYDPLVHIIRNAVDHGIESVAERRSLGKPDAGRIELRAYHAGGCIHIKVEDDGRGLDLERVLELGRERGLVGMDESPSERELVNLVFEPGFSTARQVTDVSGRGVGMDVVRRAVDSLRGQVDIRSRPGEGSSISIQLPLTLAIIDGMVVRVGDERYIVPTLSIERSLRPEPEQVSRVLDQTTVLKIDDALIPLVQIGRLFQSEPCDVDPTEAIVVIVGDNEDDRVGLVVREILGRQQIVIKALGDSMQAIAGLAGGAIMPDGRVGLIVDVGGLVRLARS